MTRRRRVSAACGAIVCLPLGLWVALLALIYSAALRRPNPDPRLDGDPCCGYPDTWGDVLGGGTYTIAIASVAIGLLVAGAALLRSAAKVRVPGFVRRRRRFLWWYGISCVGCSIAVPLSWLVGA
jgi:hypothetical protein